MSDISSAGVPVPTGRIDQTSGGYTLTFERRLDVPVNHVWEVLTSRDKVAQWLGIVTPGWHLGKEYRLDMGESEVTGTVLQMSPESGLQLTWEDPLSGESVLDWQVREEPDGAALQFRTHANSADFLAEGAAGWQGILDAFDAVVQGVEPGRDGAARWLELRDAYAEEFDVSPSMGRLDAEASPPAIVFERWYSAPVRDVGSSLDRSTGELLIGADADVDITDDAGRARVTVREPVVGGPEATAARLAAWHMALDSAGTDLAGQVIHPSSRRLAALRDFYRGPAEAGGPGSGEPSGDG